jgi:hypothetical protein
MMDTTAHAEFYPVDYSKMVRGGDSRRDGELTRRFHCVEDHANVIRLSADPLQIYARIVGTDSNPSAGRGSENVRNMGEMRFESCPRG